MIRITSIDDQAPELVPSYEVSIDPETGASVVTATFYPTDEDLFAEITALSADIQSRQEVVTDTDGRKITVTRYYHVFDRNGTYSFRYEDDLGNIGVAQAEVLGLTTDPARVISAAWYGTRQGTFSNVLPGEQLDIDWNFQAIPQESGQYSRILFKVYDISSGATLGSGQIMQENLLGEGSSYLMCPGSVTKLPVLKFTGASPDTVFTSGIRNFHVTGDNFSMLLDKSAYQLRLSRVDGARIDGRESFAIPADQFQIDDSANVISVILNDENPGTLPEGRYQLTIDYADPDKADLSGTALQFQVSDDEKFRNDTYGFLAVIEDAANGFVYSIRHFLDEEAYWDYLDSGSLDREDVLLELQGLFSKQKTEDGSIVYLGVSNNDSHNVMTLNGTLDIRSGTCTVTELNAPVNGSLFDYWTGELEIRGLTDRDTKLTVFDNTTGKTIVDLVPLNVDGSGNFRHSIRLDRTVLSHDLTTTPDAEGMVTARFLVSDQGSYDVSTIFGFTGEQIRDLDSSYTQIVTADRLYTGEARTTELQVFYRGVLLTEGVDYTIGSYTKNVEVSTETDMARVEINGMGMYAGTVTAEFRISYLPLDESWIGISGIGGNNGYYVSDVSLVAAEGYEFVIDGETADIQWTADGENTATFRVRRLSDGAMTDLVTRTVSIDTVAPVVSGIVDGETYEGEIAFTILEEHIDFVSINGEAVTGVQHILKPVDGIQTILVRDQAGNETVLKVRIIGCAGGESCPSLNFRDLDPGAWYHLSVDYVLSKGLMEGYGNGYFGPGDRMSRAMIVQVLYNLEGRPAVSAESAYKDVPADCWFTDAIVWATEEGVVNGYGGGMFGPDDPVTREQVATIFHRYSGTRGYTRTQSDYDHFEDRDQVSEYARDAMRWAVGNGLLVGMSDGRLCPRCHTNRAEFATVIQRFCETIAR